MASGKMASVNQDLSRQCTPCKTDRKKEYANIYCMDCEAYFCEECFKFHKKVPHLAKHVVLKGEEIDVWTKLPYKCKTHDRRFEFYCGEHSDLCCQVCVSLQHRSCEHMKYIQGDADTADFRRKNKKLMQKTDKQMGVVQLQIEKLERKTELNDTSKERAEECLKDFRSRMNHMLDNFEIQANEVINVRYSNNQVSLNKMEASLEKIKADLDDLKQQLTSQTPDKIILSFISLKRGQKQINGVEQSLSHMTTSLPQMKFSLILDPAIEEFFQNIDSIGNIEDDDARKMACSSEYVDDSTSTSSTVTGSDDVQCQVSTRGQTVATKLTNVRNPRTVQWQKVDAPNTHRRRPIQSFADAVIERDSDLPERSEGNATEDEDENSDSSNDDDENDGVDDDDDNHFYDVSKNFDWKLKPRKDVSKYICSNRFCATFTVDKFCPKCGSECKSRGIRPRR